MRMFLCPPSSHQRSRPSDFDFSSTDRPFIGWWFKGRKKGGRACKGRSTSCIKRRGYWNRERVRDRDRDRDTYIFLPLEKRGCYAAVKRKRKGCTTITNMSGLIPKHTLFEQVSACVAYGSVSISITLFNKAVFSIYHFHYPNLVMLGQMLVTLSLIKGASKLGYFEISRYANYPPHTRARRRSSRRRRRIEYVSLYSLLPPPHLLSFVFPRCFQA